MTLKLQLQLTSIYLLSNMKKFIPTLAFFALIAIAIAAPYVGSTIPQDNDAQIDSLRKINKLLNDQTTGATSATVKTTGAANLATGQVTGAASPVSIAAHATRRGITLRNLDSSLSVYIGSTNTVNASTGMLLKAGESISLDTTAAIYVYAASGSPIVADVETYD